MNWIPCSERLPEIDTKVLVYGDDFKSATIMERISGDKESADPWYWTDFYSPWCYPNEITHWMPLPEPPKDVKAGDK